MGEAAANGAPGARRRVAHLGERFRQQGHRRTQLRGCQRRSLARHRTDPQGAAIDRDTGESGDPVEVHDQRRPREPRRHHRHQALPAREGTRLVAVLSEEGDGVCERGRR
jgi:hypothetical protein